MQAGPFHNPPPYHQRYRCSNWVLIRWIVHLFSLDVHSFHKIFQILIHLIFIHLIHVSQSHSCFSLDGRAVTCVCLVLYGVFWKCSWAHAVISITELCLFLVQHHLMAQGWRPCNIHFWHCPVCTEISPYSMTILILCAVSDGLFKVFTPRNIILKLSTNCETIFLHSGKTVHLYFWDWPSKHVLLPNVTDPFLQVFSSFFL